MQISQPVAWPILMLTGLLYRYNFPLLLFLRGFPYLPMVRIFLKVYYPNSQSTPQMVSSLEGDLVLTCIQLHQITEEWQITVTIIFTLFHWIVENKETDSSLDFIAKYMSMVWLYIFLNQDRVQLKIPPSISFSDK